MDVIDPEVCYRAVKSRDPRFDGVFYTGVTSTGIYCRPVVPRAHAAAAQRHLPPDRGRRPGRRVPGLQAVPAPTRRRAPRSGTSPPTWPGRAMRLIADGVVERDGVAGLARRVGYTTRHLDRVLVAELGAGPLALARARRAQTARVLIETTAMSFADVAFAAGFASIRQFNDTVREVYAASPTQLRGGGARASAAGHLELRLAVRAPFDGADLLSFLAARADRGGGGRRTRVVRPHAGAAPRARAGPARARRTSPAPGTSAAGWRSPTCATCRRRSSAAVAWWTRTATRSAVADALGEDPLLAPLLRSRPGLRVPGHVDGHEVAVRAVLGQQVSVAGAATVGRAPGATAR